MEQHGIDVCGCKDAGRLQVLGWSEAYLRDGAFDKDLMLTAVQGVIDSARAAGVPRVRITGWCIEIRSSPHRRRCWTKCGIGRRWWVRAP